MNFPDRKNARRKRALDGLNQRLGRMWPNKTAPQNLLIERDRLLELVAPRGLRDVRTKKNRVGRARIA
jgi:hypothetical protein